MYTYETFWQGIGYAVQTYVSKTTCNGRIGEIVQHDHDAFEYFPYVSTGTDCANGLWKMSEKGRGIFSTLAECKADLEEGK